MKNHFARLLSVGSQGLKSVAGLPMGTTVSGGRAGGNRGWFFGSLLPGAKIDYQRKAGDPWKNVVVAASLEWIGRNLPQAPPCVYEITDKGEEKLVLSHPLTKVLKQPNRYYDGKTLRTATILSLIAGRGNAYWWIKRDNIGRPMEIWWLPHWEVWPLWDAKSTTDDWISGYAYRVNGVTYQLPERDIIHFRNGLDPELMRYGLDPLRPAAREIVTDNEAASFAAALLGNSAVPGALISPVGEASFEQGEMDAFRAQYEEMATGDNRFRPIVLSSEIKVENMSWSPEDMALSTMQDRPEARICALVGVNPVVLGLTTGLEHSKYANMKEARAAAWEDGIIPRLELINSALDTQLLPYYPDSENMRVGTDYRRVPALQDSIDSLHTRLQAACGGPFMSPNECRLQINLLPKAGYDELYPPRGIGTIEDGKGDPSSGNDTPPKAADGAADKEDADTKEIKRLIAKSWQS